MFTILQVLIKKRKKEKNLVSDMTGGRTQDRVNKTLEDRVWIGWEESGVAVVWYVQ